MGVAAFFAQTTVDGPSTIAIGNETDVARDPVSRHYVLSKRHFGRPPMYKKETVPLLTSLRRCGTERHGAEFLTRASRTGSTAQSRTTWPSWRSTILGKGKRTGGPAQPPVFGNGMAGDCSLPATSWVCSHRRGSSGTPRGQAPPRGSVQGSPSRLC